MKKRRSGVMIQSSYPPGSTHFQRRLQRQTCIPAGILNGNQATRLIEQSAVAWGRLNVLVNNASMYYPTALGTVTEAQWDDLSPAT